MITVDGASPAAGTGPVARPVMASAATIVRNVRRIVMIGTSPESGGVERELFRRLRTPPHGSDPHRSDTRRRRLERFGPGRGRIVDVPVERQRRRRTRNGLDGRA